ncbi:MAG: outer membrane beta-barrel protein [Planctomycetes bacterium]|nr:outer membrane beta-barrel protein [Planctomycetota bacterium]
MRTGRPGRRLPLPGCALVTALAALGPAAARAQEFGDFDHTGQLEEARRRATPLRAGPHAFEPSLQYKLLGVTTPHVFGALSAGYTDNLLRADKDAPGVRLVRDTFGRAEAGLRLDTHLTDHRIELEYRAGVTEYVRSGAFDTHEHLVRGRLDLIFNDASAHADASYARTAYPQTIQLRGIVRADTYSANAWGEARWNRFGARVALGGRRVEFRERALRPLEHRAFGPSLQVYFRVSPKLRAVLEYNYQRLRFDHRRDLEGFDVHQVRGGVDGEVTPKLTASVKLGGAFQRIEAGSAGAGVRDREFAGFVAEVSARWEVLPRTQVSGSYRRSIDPSLSSTHLLSDDLELSVAQRLFDEKVTARAFAGYTHSVVDRGLHLNRFRTGAAVTYLIREWLSVGAVYEFSRLTSGAPSDDFEVHTVMVSVGAGL